MNKILSSFARNWLKDSLGKCSEGNHSIFKRMYCPNNMDYSINECVDAMPDEKLDWAMQQVEQTLKKKAA